MLYRFSILVLLILMNHLSATAQQTGKVKGQAVEGATISLLKASDSSLVKLAVAGASGIFELEQVNIGEYFLQVSAVGYQTYYTTAFALKTENEIYDLKAVPLSKSSEELKAVTVTASKRMIEVKPDRTIVNVDAGISNAGATAMEVLEKSPGISVDRDGNISLKGRQGVLVLIDGKPSYLTGADLVNLLNNMMANQLDQIEIMTNPPAKYDAAGNSGIINIKTKKNKQRGWNGSLNLSYGQGAYFKTNNGLNLNYRNEKFNLFLNYSQNSNKNFNNLYIKRTYLDATGKATGYFDQPTMLRMRGDNNSLKAGIDYNLNKKTTIGITGTGFISPRKYNSLSTGYLMDTDRITDSTVQTTSKNSNKWINGTLNLNLRRNPPSNPLQLW